MIRKPVQILGALLALALSSEIRSQESIEHKNSVGIPGAAKNAANEEALDPIAELRTKIQSGIAGAKDHIIAIEEVMMGLGYVHHFESGSGSPYWMGTAYCPENFSDLVSQKNEELGIDVGALQQKKDKLSKTALQAVITNPDFQANFAQYQKDMKAFYGDEEWSKEDIAQEIMMDEYRNYNEAAGTVEDESLKGIFDQQIKLNKQINRGRREVEAKVCVRIDHFNLDGRFKKHSVIEVPGFGEIEVTENTGRIVGKLAKGAGVASPSSNHFAFELGELHGVYVYSFAEKEKIFPGFSAIVQDRLDHAGIPYFIAKGDLYAPLKFERSLMP